MKTRHNKIIKRKKYNKNRRTIKKGGAKDGKKWKTALNGSQKKIAKVKSPKSAKNITLINARRLFGSIGEQH
jgi:hypothetical protein